MKFLWNSSTCYYTVSLGPSDYFNLSLTVTVQGESAEGALLHWPDHISSKTFERMCAALGSRAANGQLALRYSLCVLTKATVYVSRWLRFGAPDGMLDSLEKSRNVYIATCLRYLQEIDFTRPPSLSMLQALLSGVSNFCLEEQPVGSLLILEGIVSTASRRNKSFVVLDCCRVQSACRPWLPPIITKIP